MKSGAGGNSATADKLLFPPTCGAGGNRTRVQTRNEDAFYMCIRLLVFDAGLAIGSPPGTYLLNFATGNSFLLTIPFSLHLRVVERRESSTGDVSSQAPWRGIKLIYFVSIKLQERSCIRHLIVRLPDLRALWRGTTCLQPHLPCCQNQSTPNRITNLHKFIILCLMI